MRLTNTRDIGLTLQTRRKTLGWTQARLANRIGITRQWVIAMEQGNAGVSVGTILRAFTALGLILDAGTRESVGDTGPGSANHDERLRRDTSSSVIDHVIERARGNTGSNPPVFRQPLPPSRPHRKTRDDK